jgi:hypothetical protein
MAALGAGLAFEVGIRGVGAAAAAAVVDGARIVVLARDRPRGREAVEHDADELISTTVRSTWLSRHKGLDRALSGGGVAHARGTAVVEADLSGVDNVRTRAGGYAAAYWRSARIRTAAHVLGARVAVVAELTA